ncbi:ABC transporter permease [Ponticoccus alexandrii]|uniref:ABC transporter permease subunit n=1 Tax=Ponticoccus alexandrii TaxID=1943633 RepID=A0ABX7FGZ5_9RHOB|nr:ABC transporter permease [Ponticoccus alexandrii]ETA52258.1 peptide ABC transporter [Rhodobacteraceae bacterium PD-2]QRF68934.1 ABC transporter permease subunit [Ponticoccus alexandrii]
MGRFLISRFASAIPTLFLVAVTVFTLIRLVPGDPAALLLGDQADAADIAALRERLGLDLSVVDQFLIWGRNILMGDFGQSIWLDEPVLPLILERFMVSIQIVLPAVLLATVVAVPAGIIAAARQNSVTDIAFVSLATVLLSIPTFWLGLLLLLFFGLNMGWFPVVGYVSVTENPMTGLLYLVLPVTTLFLHELGSVIRMSRASTLEVLRLEYITHARAKGLKESTILRRHVFKNAFGPTLTLLGLILGNLLGGIAVIETVFTIPGLGRLMIDAIYARDYPVIQGCMLFIAFVYVVVNVVIDLLYSFFDPKVTAS